ncbi:hypothetical protein RFI_31168 [Reticulomyxa filosa]|uniref:NFACT RNA-binding domain-containing protein n=1 Tax=Reticulomyxa filosa TaxID=46433 RepID=X6LX77_RETFI|nr:hypothetical protein RFI_31168 [Reticulomyxa filosa]|eukprot:ETO06229.1 hypothetical protein RFI_31168 [Reticulomyxa filosa]
MPFYFASSDPQYTIYMGEDKNENEYLIRWGWPEDLFFHVDDLSSAHVYLRTPYTFDLDALKSGNDLLTLYPIPKAVIQECMQLCKANSIDGCKKEQVDMVITPWSNLRKSISMDIGTIGFTNEKLVTKIKHVVGDKALARQIMKTKVVKQLSNVKKTDLKHGKDEGKHGEKQPHKPSKGPVEYIDLEKERIARDERELARKKEETKKQRVQKQKEVEKEKQKAREKEQQIKSYERMFEDESMYTSNKNMNMSAQEYEDGFM